jgi:uncharacterized protein YkwD
VAKTSQKKQRKSGEKPVFCFFWREIGGKNNRLKNKMVKKNPNKYFLKISAMTLMSLIFAFPVQAGEITAEKIIELTNQSRREKGLLSLEENKELVQAAKDKLNDMIENDYFAHTSPAGITPWHWFEKNGYDYRYAGENLAISFLTAEAQHRAWMESPTHRKNILNPDYVEIGVAVGAGKVNGKVSLIAVQEFGYPAAGFIPAKSGENFSAEEKNILTDDGQGFAPQVLSLENDFKNQATPRAQNTLFKNDWTPRLASATGLLAVIFSLLFLAASFLNLAFRQMATLSLKELKEKNKIQETMM